MINARFDVLEASSKEGMIDGNASFKNSEVRRKAEDKLKQIREDEIEAPWGVSILSKIEAPIFKGEVVEGWLRSMDRYFRIHKVPDNERVEKVMNFLEGEAL